MYLNVQIGFDNVIRFSVNELEMFIWDMMSDVEGVYSNYRISYDEFNVSMALGDLSVQLREKLLEYLPQLEDVVFEEYIHEFLMTCIVNDLLKLYIYPTNIEGGLTAFEVRKTVFGKYLFSAVKSQGTVRREGLYKSYVVEIKPVSRGGE